MGRVQEERIPLSGSGDDGIIQGWTPVTRETPPRSFPVGGGIVRNPPPLKPLTPPPTNPQTFAPPGGRRCGGGVLDGRRARLAFGAEHLPPAVRGTSGPQDTGGGVHRGLRS